METVEKLEEVKEKKASAKKNTAESKNKKAEKNSTNSIQAPLENSNALKIKRAKIIGGALLLLFSTYLFVAIISFFFTWSIDQDKVIDGYWTLLSNNEIKVANWLGKTGAILSHWFMHRGFGIASLFLVPVIFALGFKLVFKVKLFSFRKTIKHCFLLLLLVSTSTSFVFNHLIETEWFFIGGNFGYQVNMWLISFFGLVGTALMLVALNAGYAYLGFNWNGIGKKIETVVDDIKVNEFDNELKVGHIDESAETKISPKNWNEFEKEEEIQLSKTLKKEMVNSLEPVMEIENLVEDNSLVQDFEINLNNKLDKIPAKGEGDLELIVEHQINVEPEFIAPNNMNDNLEDDGFIHAEGDFDPKADLSAYVFPEIDLLEKHGNDSITINNEELQANKDRILDTLKNYSIEIEKIKATIGPTVTLYEIVPAPGVRISKIKNLEDDIALSLSALGIRIIAPMPGKGTIGIEVPNQKPEVVSMRSIIASEKFQNTNFDLPIALGKTITNDTFITDLAKMPHLLMAGATGQGKSVGLNAILVSLLYKKHPSQIKFVLVDPKKVELTLFNTIERHFLAKLPNAEESIITDTKKVIHTLNSLCILMDARYELLKNAMVRNIKEYNAKFISRKLNPLEGHHYMPYIVLVVDEFADLIMTAGKEVEMPIARLAQLARAIGIHLIIATQRPSVNIITGTIKANFPARIAFRVSSKIDSRTILDAGGAEQLIGRGDMLLSTGNDLIRIQCAFVDTPEVDKITEFIGAQRAYPQPYLLPEYVDENDNSEKESIDLSQRDSFFEEAARIIVQHQQGSTSLIQRRLKLGYNRAGRIVDQLEAAGIIGPFEGSKARQVLIKDEQSLEHILKGI
ncbi:MAG TPA: DNA translocase FtsK [Bacteroidia bacterium]|nr:DNA translocase FtsK [Bacteroidia bacterium]